MIKKMYGISNPKLLDYLLAIVFVLTAIGSMWIGLWVFGTKTYTESSVALSFLGRAFAFDWKGYFFAISLETILIYAGIILSIIFCVCAIKDKKYMTIPGIVAFLLGDFMLCLGVGFFGYYSSSAVNVSAIFSIVLALITICMLLVIVYTGYMLYELLFNKLDYKTYCSDGKSDNDKVLVVKPLDKEQGLIYAEDNSGASEESGVEETPSEDGEKVQEEQAEDLHEEIPIENESADELEKQETTETDGEKVEAEELAEVVSEKDETVEANNEEAVVEESSENEMETEKDVLPLSDEKQEVEEDAFADKKKRKRNVNKNIKRGLKTKNVSVFTFEERLALSSPKIKAYFKELKDYFVENGFKTAMTKKSQAFYSGNSKVAMITITKKYGMMAYYKLDPKDYVQTSLPVRDKSNVKKYEGTPLMLIIKSNLSVKRAKRLVRDLLNRK